MSEKSRILYLNKQREREKVEIEKQLKKIEEDKEKTRVGLSKFTANYDSVEESLRTKTVGLVTLDEMKDLQKEGVLHRDKQVARGELVTTHVKVKASTSSETDKIVEKHTQKRVLSFGFGEEEDDEEPVVIVKKRVGMDPSVDTSFLPDKEREAELTKKREELAEEWRMKQEAEKNEEIIVSYAYWDGSSHRKNMKVKKGHTISQFLAKAIEALRKDFSEVKSSTPEMLMFVKEDLIIPHFYTFLDFIATKAMGKSGPLYVFEASGDVRVRQEVAPEYGEVHPVKVVLRGWYEKNKHIYPASRWEPFVPSKKYGNEFDELSGN